MRLLLAAFATALLPALALAAEPTGEWRVANGLAVIRIDDCDGALWGIVAWEQQPGTDQHNPNPAERNRPTLGLHILRDMRPTKPGLWQGEVYDAENGKTYNSRISLTAPDVLRIEGCVFGGLICGGENWTRVSGVPDQAAAPVAPAPRASTPTSPTSQPRASRPAPAPAATRSACSGIAEGTGAAHQGRLKQHGCCKGAGQRQRHQLAHARCSRMA
jgi:uncharacterized protein (DUF2147 family)